MESGEESDGDGTVERGNDDFSSVVSLISLKCCCLLDNFRLHAQVEENV